MTNPGRNRTLDLSQLVLAAWLMAAVPAVAAELTAPLRPAEASPLVRAEIRAERTVVQSGRPVWVEFTLTNLTSDPLTLRAPGSSPDLVEKEMGLPLGHVFSGPGHTAVTVTDSGGEMFDAQVSLRPRGGVPMVRLAPYASVGIRVDLALYYESLLHRPGKYTLVWKPYDGTIESKPLALTIMAERQAVILTRFGKMTIRFYYEEAPLHVQNFIELVEQRFYDNLTFHRVIPGGLIQGGDPLGDGRGTRPDGKRVPAEFSKIPFEMGTVGMARSSRDPNSASCQFFICLSRQPSFDGQQTPFGYLHGDESFETLRQIAAVPTGPKDRPVRPVAIQTISLENVPSRDRETMITQNPSTRPAAVARTGPEPAPILRRPRWESTELPPFEESAASQPSADEADE